MKLLARLIESGEKSGYVYGNHVAFQMYKFTLITFPAES